MKIDLQTTVLLYVSISYICTIIIGSSWLENRKKFRGIELIFIDFVLQSIGLTLATCYKVLPKFASVLLANIFMYLGAIFLLFGVSRFINIPLKKRGYILTTVTFSCLYGYFTFVSPDPRIRLMIFTLMIIPVFLITSFVVFTRADANHRKYAFNVGLVHLLFALTHGVRAVMSLREMPTSDYYSFSSNEAVLIMISQLLMIYLTFAVTQMIHIKLLDHLDNYIHKTEQLLDETKYLATTDSLTHIFNRRKVEDILALEVDNFYTYEVPVSVLMVDIDHFKRFNDTYGHDIGDKVLCEIAKVLKDNIRKTDTIGRWGGEEFLIVLHRANVHIALSVAEKLAEKVKSLSLDYCNPHEQITVSIGCSELKSPLGMTELVKHADDALYLAKDRGRDRVETTD